MTQSNTATHHADAYHRITGMAAPAPQPPQRVRAMQCVRPPQGIASCVYMDFVAHALAFTIITASSWSFFGRYARRFREAP